MEKVTGIGGIFFRAGNPVLLQNWYAEHLGVKPPPSSYEEPEWRQEAGPTILAPFNRDTDYFRRREQQFMTNFRVRDLDSMVAQLRDADIAVEPDPETYPNGRFAGLSDPEGNPIQLWEPSTRT